MAGRLYKPYRIGICDEDSGFIKVTFKGVRIAMVYRGPPETRESLDAHYTEAMRWVERHIHCEMPI